MPTRRPRAIRPVRRVPRKTKGTASLTRKIKAISLKQVETKRVSHAVEDEILRHNVTSYTIDNLLGTAQGIQNPGAVVPFPQGEIRVGNEIIARGISIKLWLENSVNHPNLMYRIVLFKYPSRMTPVLNDQFLWQGNDGLGGPFNRMIDTIANNRVKILYSTVVKPTPFAQFQGADSAAAGGHSKTTLLEKYINLKNLKVRYTEAKGTRPMFDDICLAVVPFDTHNTPQGLELARMSHSVRVYFKDP